MPVSVSVTIDIEDLPVPSIDEGQISKYISDRLNDARNVFIMRMGRGGGLGQIYRRGGHWGRHSAPGEYPATMDGRLQNSVDWELRGEREGVLYTDVYYGKYLTEGTIHMEPRRMLRDAMQEVMDNRPATDQLASAVRIE